MNDYFNPIDIDDIHDYYEAQRLESFFDSVIAADEKRKKQAALKQERSIKNRVGRFLYKISNKLLQDKSE